MVASYTSNLRITKQGDNDNPNTWGQVVNNQVIELIEDAISGVAEIDITGVSDINLSTTVVNGGFDDARNMTLLLVGTLGANINLIVPSVEKAYLIKAVYSGNFTVNIKPVGGSGGVVVETGDSKVLSIYGTSIYEIAGNVDESLFLQVANNLSDLNDVTVAQTNLDVYSKAAVDAAILAATQNSYPVGSLYFNASVATNPSSLLGFGTWEAFAPGRTFVSVGSGTDANGFSKSFALGDTGGEYQHTQTTAEVGPHKHNLKDSFMGVAAGSGAGLAFGIAGGFNVGETTTTPAATPMQWMQPYMAVHVWRRTA